MDLRKIDLPDFTEQSVKVNTFVNLKHSQRKLCALLWDLWIVELVCRALYWAKPREFCQ
jgi:hypothetical protein